MTPKQRRVLEIIATEAAAAHIRPTDTTGTSRTATIVKALMWRARQETGLSFSQLVWLFRKDHAGIVRVVKRKERVNGD